MPKINANFQFESMQPNFERDSMTFNEMTIVSKLKLDVGHIVYCKPDEKTAEESKYREGYHYIFQGGDAGNFDTRWKKIQTTEELVFWTIDITNGTYNQDGSVNFTTDVGDHSWTELKSIGDNSQLLVLVLIYKDGENNQHKIFMPCNIDDLGAVINISSRHLTGMSTGGYELYLNCQQDRGSTPWGIIGGGKLYYYEDTISNDYINNLN